jgi:exosortase/archaeosortase family protein
MFGTKIVVSFFGYSTVYEPNFLIRVVNKRGVIISQGCVGYGVMSFWIAFIFASKSNFKKKAFWIFNGLILIWLINVIRIGLFLVAINKGWKMPLGIDHHTWFNIFAYTGVFTLIYFYEKSLQANEG